jgi:hypothetical protein
MVFAQAGADAPALLIGAARILQAAMVIQKNAVVQ